MSRVKYLIFFVYFCALAPGFCAPEKIVLRLDEAITIALRDNRDILLDEEKLSQAKLNIEESRAAFLPEATLGGTAADTRGLYRKDVISYSFTAGLKQYIYKGGKSRNTLKESRYKKEAQEALLEKTRACKSLGVDAINVPDGPRASSRLSPLVTAERIGVRLFQK